MYRNDIGIPDIYESEVEVAPQHERIAELGKRLAKPRWPLHELAADTDRLVKIGGKKALLPLGALKRNENSKSSKRDTSKDSSSKGRGRRRNSVAKRRRPATFGRKTQQSKKFATITHLNYRRPVSFKFKRTERLKKRKKLTTPKYEVKNNQNIALHDGISPQKALLQMPFMSHYGQQITISPLMNRALPKGPNGRRKIQNPVVDKEQKDVNKNSKSNEKSDPIFKDKIAYESLSASTVSPVLYKKEPEKIPQAIKINNPSNDGPQPPSDHLPPGHGGSKTAAVPGWLMDLKNEPVHPTPPPGYHPTPIERKKKSSSPQPSDYALKASKPKIMSHGYGMLKYNGNFGFEDHHTLGPNLPIPPHVPNHFHLIKATGTDSLIPRHPPVPPPHIHVPLDAQYLPPSDQNKPYNSNPKTAYKPHYPVTSSQNDKGGTDYHLKLTTPKNIYVTPLKFHPNSPLENPLVSVPIYAPPTSPKPKNYAYTPPSYGSSVSGKPFQHESEHTVIELGLSYPSLNKQENPAVKEDVKSLVAPHVTTYKPPKPKDDLVKLKEFSYPSSSKVSLIPKIRTTTYSPPVYTPHSVFPSHPLHKPSSQSGITDNHFLNFLMKYQRGLLPQSVDDYFYYDDDFYYDNDDFYYYDDYYNYINDLYDLNYYYDLQHPSESRPGHLPPPPLLPSSSFELSSNHIYDFGYIAGIPGN